MHESQVMFISECDMRQNDICSVNDKNYASVVESLLRYHLKLRSKMRGHTILNFFR